MSKTPRPALEPTALNAPGLQRRLLCRGAAGLLLGGLNLGLAGCGGGSTDDTTANATEADELRQPLGGVDSGGTGAAMAMFVSAVVGVTVPLTVNAVQYDTADSLIVDGDGQAVDALALLPGMACEIEATRTSSTATVAAAQRIRVAEQLLGPVASVDAASNSLTVLGQRVVITVNTRFDAALAGGLAALQVGQLVRVWGQLDSAGGRTVATRVGLVASAEAWVVRGVLAGLDSSAGTLRIGGLQATVAAGGGAVIPAGLQVGDVVRARLSAGLSADGAGVLLALRGDALQVPDWVSAELEGRITRIDSALRFAVDGVTVEAAGASAVVAAAKLALGARVAVAGRSAQGVLLATSVKIESDEPVQLEGVITAADALRGSFVMRGVTVVWTTATTFEGGTARLLRVRRKAAVLGRWSADRTVLEARHIHVEA